MLSASIKRNKSDLLDFGEVDLSLKGIRVINRVPPSMHFISQLYLDGNHLLSLSGIEQFLNLEVLHFDYNYISLPEELEKVSNPFFMTEISFIGNPIQNSPNLVVDSLRKNGFSRLTVLNPPHQLSKKDYCLEEKEESREIFVNGEEFTTRRHPKYKNEDATTQRKRMIGKIYTTSKFKTVRQEETRERTLSKENRESTGRPSTIDSSFHRQLNGKASTVTAFQINFRPQEVVQEEERTAGFNSGQGSARFDGSNQKQSFSSQFFAEQKQRLAFYFYNRTLLQKSFKGLQFGRIIQNSELQEFDGELINDYLQTLHFSLIKLRNQAARS